MLDSLDALALSVWAHAPRRRVAELLQSLAVRLPASGGAGGDSGDVPDSLEALLAWLDDSQDVAALAGRLRADVGQALERADRAGIDAVTWGTSDYPPLLAAIPDPPPALWVRGNPAVLQRLSVAVVGSRAASPYGLEVAALLAHDLAAAGVVVVSGLARGVDGAAHRGALAGGGATVAVLGCGADVVYPSEHADLHRDVAASGAVVSELPPGTVPQAHFFPRRNRIISGLSRGVVVVEAAERSGSLITAAAALEQGREVMAAPGSILTGRHRGSHALVRDGALLVTGASDVLAAVGRLPFDRPAATPADRPSGDPVLDALSDGDPCTLDDLAARTSLSAAALLVRLLGLEVAGEVGRLGGGLFVRLGRNVLT